MRKPASAAVVAINDASAGSRRDAAVEVVCLALALALVALACRIITIW